MPRARPRKSTLLGRLARFFAILIGVAILLAGGAAYAVFLLPLEFAPSPQSFDVKSGSTMKTIARDLRSAGIIPLDWPLVALARASQRDRTIQAGNYEFSAGLTPWELLQKLTEGDATQDALTIVEGWNFVQLRA